MKHEDRMGGIRGSRLPYSKSLTKLENQIVLFEKEQEHYEEALLEKDLLIKSQTNKIRELSEQTQRLNSEINNERDRLDELIQQWEEINRALKKKLEVAKNSCHVYQRRAMKIKEENKLLEMELNELKGQNASLICRLNSYEKNPLACQTLGSHTRTEVSSLRLKHEDSCAQSLVDLVDPLKGDQFDVEQEHEECDGCDKCDNKEFPTFHEDEENQYSVFNNELESSDTSSMDEGTTSSFLGDEMVNTYQQKIRQLEFENELLTHQNHDLIRQLNFSKNYKLTEKDSGSIMRSTSLTYQKNSAMASLHPKRSISYQLPLPPVMSNVIAGDDLSNYDSKSTTSGSSRILTGCKAKTHTDLFSAAGFCGLRWHTLVPKNAMEVLIFQRALSQLQEVTSFSPNLEDLTPVASDAPDFQSTTPQLNAHTTCID
ncbi:uncharacterized protein Ecym_1128 [Eremothecium cymbalariae DBVPG|uniref:Uncharacterized protein n=1 Tax=Eremothecium cymbalariae (strain CBS 270.75 / DBVPG 7215 / KCTC 17166 / NRRL Y-17582) TaxID=931890 RepID=G8JMM6_ERECY|nr:hypothetical protein Ecym_1128 [Eremothecium cymbalariae DBVPG\